MAGQVSCVLATNVVEWQARWGKIRLVLLRTVMVRQVG